jgi:DNA helicase-2/ATP-dependent DNA helicase PcrA
MQVCPHCGTALVMRQGKRGAFYTCPMWKYDGSGCKGVIVSAKELNKAVKAHHKTLAAANASIDVSHIKHSNEQLAIYDAAVNDDRHIVINALAGTGKSFVCEHIIRRLPKHLNVGYIVFNKRNQLEFQAKGLSCSAQTCNGAGWKACLRNLKGIKLEKNKLQLLFDTLVPEETEDEDEIVRKILRSNICNIVNLCKGYLFNGTENDINFIIERHTLELSEMDQKQAYDLVPKILKLAKQNTAIADFTDQMWLVVEHDLPIEQYDVLLVDEVQDLNTLKHKLALKMLKPNGKMIIVGDVNQALYGWTGSDIDSINNFVKLLERTGKTIEQFPLTINRRCSKAVIRKAQEIVEQIQAREDAPEGQVNEIKLNEAIDKMQAGDMVVCRVNAPLCGIAYKLLRKGVRCKIQGRDVGDGLVSLIVKMRVKSVNDLLPKLEDWKEKEIEKVSKSRNSATLIENIQDKFDCVTAFLEGNNTVNEVINQINQTFADFDDTGAYRDCVTLSSIHRAKGLEADNVFWAMPEVVCKAPQEWQQVQERNAKYVAETRARIILTLCPQK